MAYPTPIIEIAFDDGPYVVSPTWTDVTAYCRGFSTSRGVPDDWTYQADGSASVTLSNRDRRFDPFNTSGPYYGKLLPRRQIRIRATSGATTYNVFRGFIAGWPPQWTDAGYDSTVELSCFDALQLLGSSSMPGDWAMPFILSLQPTHYWELDDPIDAFNADSYLLRDRGKTPSKFNAGQTTTRQGSQIANGLPSHSIGTDQANGPSDLTDSVPNTTYTNWSISYWTIAASSDTESSYFNGYLNGGTFMMFQHTDVNAGDYGKFQVQFINATNNYTWKTVGVYEPGQPYMFTFTYASGTGVIYINGTADTDTRTSSAGSPVYAYERYALSYGFFQQLAVFDTTVTASNVNALYRFSTANYGESTSERMQRIINQTPFSLSLVSWPVGQQGYVVDLTPNAPTASSELTKVSNSEYAPLFVNKAGTLTLYNQNKIRSQTSSIVSQATYGAGGLSIGTDIQLQYDGDSMRNVANISMSAGGVYIDENSTSITTYGESEQYIDTQVGTYEDAVQIGNIVTGWGGQVYAKASPVDVVLDPSASWASTLGLELFDRITLAVAPKTGNTITVPMLVSRISHNVTPERWSTSLEGSARWAAVFILGTSTLGGTDLLG